MRVSCFYDLTISSAATLASGIWNITTHLTFPWYQSTRQPCHVYSCYWRHNDNDFGFSFDFNGMVIKLVWCGLVLWSSNDGLSLFDLNGMFWYGLVYSSCLNVLDVVSKWWFTSLWPRWYGHLKQVGVVDSQVGEGLAILPEDHHDDGSGESESE